MSTAAKTIAMPATTHILLCGKCGRELVVSKRTVMAFCKDCSSTLGVKK